MGLTFVPVLEESPRTYLVERTEEGYQRFGSATRMNLFAEFLHQHPLSVVPPVVLSGRDAWRFVDDGADPVRQFGSLVIDDAAAIVDGQHRVGGYIRLFEHYEEIRHVDFLLIPNLSVEEETIEFVTINNNQKGVTKALTAYLEGSDEALIAVELNAREDSPLVGRITNQR